MTLRARIRLVPSRHLAVAGALATTGAAASPLVVLFAWIEPAWLGPVAVAAMAGGALLGLRIYRHVMGRGALEVLISEQGSIELLGLGSDETPGPYRLAAGSLAWPGLSVLVLEPVDPHDDVASRGVVRIAVLRRDLDVDDARHLHRLMLWSLRGGAAATA